MDGFKRTAEVAPYTYGLGFAHLLRLSRVTRGSRAGSDPPSLFWGQTKVLKFLTRLIYDRNVYYVQYQVTKKVRMVFKDKIKTFLKNKHKSFVQKIIITINNLFPTSYTFINAAPIKFMIFRNEKFIQLPFQCLSFSKFSVTLDCPAMRKGDNQMARCLGNMQHGTTYKLLKNRTNFFLVT